MTYIESKSISARGRSLLPLFLVEESSHILTEIALIELNNLTFDGKMQSCKTLDNLYA